MRLVETATRRRVTIAMFTIAIAVFGLVSLSQLKINLLPDLSYPTLTVRTEYIGAAPVEIENLVTKPVEEVLGVVKNVQEIRSVSRTGQSDVVLQFVWGTNMDIARQDVRESLDALALPLDASRPLILRFDPSLDPVMRFGVYFDNPQAPDSTRSAGAAFVSDSGSDRPLDDETALTVLRRFADEQIKKRLESAPGVAAVKISGGYEDEVQVLVDPDMLDKFDLTYADVTRVLQSENVNLSGGTLEEGTQQYLVRTVNQFETVSEMANVIVDADGIAPVYIRDLADVRLGYKEREAITRINGREAIEIAVYKEGDANTVTVARAAQGEADRIAEILPSGARMDKVYDQSRFIKSSIDNVVNAAVVGGILAILILYLFLRDFRPTLIIGLSIPVSVVATFAMMKGADLSLNVMSLGGLALGIGLLVDNSIVVLENVSRHRADGKSTFDAARDGASEVAMAVVASTLTTVAVFFPLVFVSGIAGQLFRDQALTVTFSLLASLAVALTLIPMLASLGSRRREDPTDVGGREPRTRVGAGVRSVRIFLARTVPMRIGRGLYVVVALVGKLVRVLAYPLVAVFNKAYDALAGRYPSIVSRALRHRPVVVVTAFALLAVSAALVPRLGIELIPTLAQGEFDISLQLPAGTPLEKTDDVVRRVQSIATSVPEIGSTFGVAGTGNRLDANPDEGGENWGELHVLLTDERDETERAALGRLREAFGDVPSAQYKFSRPTLFSFDTPIEIEVSGFDLGDLQRATDRLAADLRTSDRFADVKSSMESGHPELQIQFDRERAAVLGLAVHEIADRVVSHVRGDVATRYSWNDRKIDVLVRSRESDRRSAESISNIIVNPESPRPISLSDVAEVHADIGPGEIRRVAQQRVGLVTANLQFGDLGTAGDEIEQIIAGMSMPAGISAQLAGQSLEMSRSFRSLILALALAVFLVYLVMASQFESLIHPLVIFFSIPLAAVGAVLALFVTGTTISVVVFIGLILLAGIVVNNAIVLVDLINQLRSAGLSKDDAIVEAGRLRLRPILMTTLTTTLGLLPLAIGAGEGAEIRAPMAITVIGGLVVSTVLTLVVIPVMYSLLDRKKVVAGRPSAG